MKKTLLLTIALFLSAVAFSQSHVFLSESFDGENFPEGWTLSETGKDNWEISVSNHAGGKPNELFLNNFPPLFNETTRVISPAVNLNSVDEVILSFRHCLNNNIDAAIQQTPYVIGVATSTDMENWTTIWSEEYKESGVYQIFEFINTTDLGDNVHFSLFFTGANYMINGWVFDDIIVYSQDDTDLEMISLNFPEMSNYGEHEISFTVQNIGISAISSFEAKYEGIDGIVVSETFETNMESLEIKEFTFSEASYITPGSYNLKVELTSVNGENDGNENNNIAEKNIEIGMGYASKVPMIEHFSSSTCSYCVEPNKIIKQVLADNPGKYTYTKYPTKFPGMGDPYTTEEVKNRVNYYQVNGAPEFYLDGIWKAYEIVSPDDIDSVFGSNTFLDVRGAFTVEGNTINIIADFMSYIKIDSVRAFISINEKTTTENVATNGETEFHHIMMKMLADDKGNPINLKAGEHKRLEFSYNMDSTFMEDINDLEVALWLQNHETHEIYNSRYAYEYTEHCYPVQNLTLNVDGNNKTIRWEAPEKGNPTGYKVLINSKVVIESTSDLSYNFTSSDELFIAEVIALYEEEKTSVAVAKTYRQGENIVEHNNELNCNIYPNPASDILTIATEASVEEIAIYDVYGRLCCRDASNASTSNSMDTFNVSVQDLETGVYFVNIKTENGNIVKRFVKN
ncbi:MAG: T9SS type A sorting domain-containing protein [Lentimicrobiaceae bacterium]|nr:T9SS type A sorting domain-containing protein [Lentimicrobiaceae bacterium]